MVGKWAGLGGLGSVPRLSKVARPSIMACPAAFSHSWDWLLYICEFPTGTLYSEVLKDKTAVMSLVLVKGIHAHH